MFHLSSNGCALVLQKDLEYWGIDELMMEPCCALKYYPEIEICVNEKSVSPLQGFAKQFPTNPVQFWVKHWVRRKFFSRPTLHWMHALIYLHGWAIHTVSQVMHATTTKNQTSENAISQIQRNLILKNAIFFSQTFFSNHAWHDRNHYPQIIYGRLYEKNQCNVFSQKLFHPFKVFSPLS